jgi:hypothetical protein
MLMILWMAIFIGLFLSFGFVRLEGCLSDETGPAGLCFRGTGFFRAGLYCLLFHGNEIWSGTPLPLARFRPATIRILTR